MTETKTPCCCIEFTQCVALIINFKYGLSSKEMM